MKKRLMCRWWLLLQLDGRAPGKAKVAAAGTPLLYGLEAAILKLVGGLGLAWPLGTMLIVPKETPASRPLMISL